MKKKIAALATTAFLVACGSSSDDYYAVGPVASPLTTVQIKAVGMGADFDRATKTVCYDRNLNGKCDLLEPVVSSADNTKLILTNVINEDLANVPVLIIAENAAKVKTTYVLPAGFTTLSPVTKYANAYFNYAEGFNFEEGTTANSIVNSSTDAALINAINIAPNSAQKYTVMKHRPYILALNTLATEPTAPTFADNISEYRTVKSFLDGAYANYTKINTAIGALETYLKGRDITLPDADTANVKYIYLPYPSATTSAAFNTTYEAFVLDLFLENKVKPAATTDPDKKINYDAILAKARKYFGKSLDGVATVATDATLAAEQKKTYDAIVAADSYFLKAAAEDTTEKLLVDSLKTKALTVYNFAKGSYNDGKKMIDPSTDNAKSYTVIETAFARPSGLLYTARSTGIPVSSLVAAGSTQKLPVVGNNDIIPVSVVSPYYTATYSDIKELSTNDVTYTYLREYNLTTAKGATAPKASTLFPSVTEVKDLVFTPGTDDAASYAYVIKRASAGSAVEYDPNLIITLLNLPDNKNKDITALNIDEIFLGANSKVTYGKAIYSEASKTYKLEVNDPTTGAKKDFGTIYTKEEEDKVLLTAGTFTFLPEDTTDPVEAFYSNAVELPKEGKYSQVGSGTTSIVTFKTYKNVTPTVEAQDSLFVLTIFNRNMYDTDKTQDLVFVLSEVKNPAPLIGFNAEAATKIVETFK